jgi:Protein of unknown function (DUF3105)
MSSRQQEKERRRQERLAREREAAAAARRRRLIGYASGGVLAIAIVVAVAVAVAGGGGSKHASAQGPKLNPTATVPIPPQKIKNLNAAVAAAGCTLHTFIPGPNDRDHVLGHVTYKQNPPVFGPHYPIPAHDGDYAGQTPPRTEQLVHPLEHGRIDIWYRPGLPSRQLSQLETLYTEPIASGAPKGYKQLLVSRASMPFAVAATAWGQQLGCPTVNDKVFDAIRAFRAAFVDHGPEQIPFPE